MTPEQRLEEATSTGVAVVVANRLTFWSIGTAALFWPIEHIWRFISTVGWTIMVCGTLQFVAAMRVAYLRRKVQT